MSKKLWLWVKGKWHTFRNFPISEFIKFIFLKNGILFVIQIIVITIIWLLIDGPFSLWLQSKFPNIEITYLKIPIFIFLSYGTAYLSGWIHKGHFIGLLAAFNRWIVKNSDWMLKALIIGGGVVMLGIVVGLIWKILMPWWEGNGAIASSDDLRNLIFAIGGVGAAIGLWFAKVRQEKFSDQVQTQIDQSFNDRLGRGVELLANDNVTMRQAGLRVLGDLIKNTDDQDQKHIIANIIHDFIRDKARLRYEKDQDENVTVKKVEKTEDRQDIALAVEILMQIHLDDQVTLPLTFNGSLNLTNLDFRNVNFSNMSFEKVDFSGSDFVETIFIGTNFDRVRFQELKLDQVNFSGSQMKRPIFLSSVISGADFSQARIEDGLFGKTEIKHSRFDGAEMIGCSIIWGKITIGNTSPDLIGCSLHHARFDYSEYPSDINKMDFSKCYFPIDDLPSISVNQEVLDETDENIVDKTRGYTLEYGTIVFVESDEGWSRQPAREWVDVKIAEWRLGEANKKLNILRLTKQNTETIEKDIVDLEEDLEAKEKALREAKAEFDQKVREAEANERTNPN